eukprot:CCRYP_017585-RA/>CCRYP_017585-RA protein AED:0.36 eAED:0.36 QI:9/1/1/1/0/0/2/283/129
MITSSLNLNPVESMEFSVKEKKSIHLGKDNFFFDACLGTLSLLVASDPFMFDFNRVVSLYSIDTAFVTGSKFCTIFRTHSIAFNNNVFCCFDFMCEVVALFVIYRLQEKHPCLYFFFVLFQCHILYCVG